MTKRLAMAQSCVASASLRSSAAAARHNKRARRLEPGRHIGEAELQGLELFQPFAEGAALFHVGQRLFQRDLGAAERTGRDVEPAAVKAGHGDLKTNSFFAEPVAGRVRARPGR